VKVQDRARRKPRKTRSAGRELWVVSPSGKPHIDIVGQQQQQQQPGKEHNHSQAHGCSARNLPEAMMFKPKCNPKGKGTGRGT
jgi:hypothetical protein